MSTTVARGQKGMLAMLANPRGLWRFLRDPQTPRGTKLLAVLAVVYLVSPVDAVPELVAPLVGWLDDLGVAAVALTWLASKGARYERDRSATDDPQIAISAAPPPAASTPSAGAAGPPTPGSP